MGEILITVSDLILDLIRSKIGMIDIIPPSHNLYLLQVLLAPSEITMTVTVAPIIIMTMLRVFAIRNIGSRWSLSMIMLSVKMPDLRQGPPLPVEPHSFSSLLIFDKMVTKALARGLVLGR